MLRSKKRGFSVPNLGSGHRLVRWLYSLCRSQLNWRDNENSFLFFFAFPQSCFETRPQKSPKLEFTILRTEGAARDSPRGLGFEPSLARLRAPVRMGRRAEFYERFLRSDRPPSLNTGRASNSPRLPDILNLGIMPHIHM